MTAINLIVPAANPYPCPMAKPAHCAIQRDSHQGQARPGRDRRHDTQGDSREISTTVTVPPDDIPASEHAREPVRSGDGRPLIFCGMCGALNPATNYYCAACGTTLVDAFHATEGLRVYERPDSASRLIEIVPSGTELDLVEEREPHEDFLRVRLESGKLGYIRLQEVDAMAGAPQPSGALPTPDINTHARGCVSTTGALGAVALVIVLGILLFAVMLRSNTYDRGTMLILGCFGLGPLLILTIGFYLYASSRDDRIAADAEEAMLDQQHQESGE
jgi:hypothetical protein